MMSTPTHKMSDQYYLPMMIYQKTQNKCFMETFKFEYMTLIHGIEHITNSLK